MGFVPRSQTLVGKSFPKVTKEALDTFTNEMKQQNELKNHPIDFRRPKTTCALRSQETHEIYPRKSGMIPRYGGHVPGKMAILMG